MPDSCPRPDRRPISPLLSWGATLHRVLASRPGAPATFAGSVDRGPPVPAADRPARMANRAVRPLVVGEARLARVAGMTAAGSPAAGCLGVDRTAAGTPAVEVLGAHSLAAGSAAVGCRAEGTAAVDFLGVDFLGVDSRGVGIPAPGGTAPGGCPGVVGCPAAGIGAVGSPGVGSPAAGIWAVGCPVVSSPATSTGAVDLRAPDNSQPGTRWVDAPVLAAPKMWPRRSAVRTRMPRPATSRRRVRRSAGCAPAVGRPRPVTDRNRRAGRLGSRLLQFVEEAHHNGTPGWVKYQKAELNHTTVNTAASSPPSRGSAHPGRPLSRSDSIFAANTP